MRPIDADALREDLIHNRGFYPVIVKRAIIEAPTIEAEPVKHGRWIKQEHFAWRHICSECEYYGSVLDEPVIPFNYCPNCGCKMDLEET